MPRTAVTPFWFTDWSGAQHWPLACFMGICTSWLVFQMVAPT